MEAEEFAGLWFFFLQVNVNYCCANIFSIRSSFVSAVDRQVWPERGLSDQATIDYTLSSRGISKAHRAWQTGEVMRTMGMSFGLQESLVIQCGEEECMGDGRGQETPF